MKPEDITIVVGIDTLYVQKLWYAYQTWAFFKPEIVKMPLLLICDRPLVRNDRGEWSLHARLTEFIAMAKDRYGQCSVEVIEWAEDIYASQRAKMLTALVFCPAKHVKTPWYLKIDCDTIACNGDAWIKDEWFAPVNGKLPCFVSSPWPYSKPGNVLDIMDDWGDTVPGLKDRPRLNIEHAQGSETVKSPRIISWLMFGNTAWLQEVVKYCPNMSLPYPSQDTYVYYVAARRGDHYVRTRMSEYGWQHLSRFSTMTSAADRLLGTSLVPWKG